MVKQLFKRFLSTATVIAGCMFVANAQSTSSLTTAFTTSSPAYGTIPTPQFITFNVTNNNSCPITMTEIDMFHVGSITLTGTPNIDFSSNGTEYTLWRQQPAVAGAPNIAANTGWVPEATSGPINNGTSAGSIINIFKGLSITVPPATTIRFAIASKDSIGVFYNVTPTSFAGTGTGAGVVLTTGGGTTYYGTMPGPGATTYPINGNPGIIAFCGTIRYTDAGGAAPAPPKVVNNGPKICKGGQLVLTASAPSYIAKPIYTFTGPPSGGILQQGTNNVYVKNGMTLADAGIYNVTIIDSNCGAKESLPFSTNITVSDPPAPTVTGKTDFCLNEPFMPVGIEGTGTPRWYYSATGGSPLPFTPPFNTTSVTQDTFYVAQIINGCESEKRTMVVYRSSAKPAPPLVTTPLYFCENDEAQPLTATGNQLKWYYDPIGGIPSLIPPTPNTTAKTTNNYYVTQSNRGCESNRSLIKVVVTFKPNGLILSSKQKLCERDTLTLSYYGSAYDSSGFNWTFPTGATVLTADPHFSRSIVVAMDSAGLREIKLQVGHDGCYSDVYGNIIRVDTLPTADISVRPDICLGQTEMVSLNSYTLTTDTFTWGWDNGVVSYGATDQGPNGVTWHTPGKKYITLRLVNKLCSNTVTDSTYIHAKPDASFKIEGFDAGKVYCSGDSMRVTANTINADSKYSWSPTRFFDEYSDKSSAYVRVDFPAYVRLDVKDQYGCFNSDSIKVMTKPCCNIIIPSAFSPNGDTHNDIFRIKQSKEGVQRYIQIRTFKVVNRYGQVVFETANELTGWDGTFNGKPADLGTYFYYCAYKCDGKMMEEKGEVVLVR
eukprot:TRINITY_DN57579_c0_g1_i1.p1 TRINITY_DN57579_c0_g1~~TRINITY_DN57579_c0_g1_i1.p1  ORF type:complete len:829 (-),score=47.23 TRINITY_DN57579_c0_g1_i1:40-2526(-)